MSLLEIKIKETNFSIYKDKDNLLSEEKSNIMND